MTDAERKVRANIRKCRREIKRRKLPSSSLPDCRQLEYYWLGWLDAMTGEKP